jgi:uncharacterized membrane protein YfcA
MTLKLHPAFWKLIATGLAAGVLSGLFGVGGGTVIVPLLLFWVGMDHRSAAGTSMTAILPTAVVGAISYSVSGNVDWIAALCLAIGVVVGAQLGAWLLAKLPRSTLQMIFMIFLLVIIVSLWFVVPSRDAQVHLTVVSIAGLVLTGLITGVLAGLMGVGGGAVVVPAMMFFFGANDLVAKGTSLVMMIPGSVSGTIGNFRRKNLDLSAALIVGITASAITPFAALLARLITPTVGNILFSLYLAGVVTQMLIKWLKARRQENNT